MADPILVEVTRGPLVESTHAGLLAIADANGRRVAAFGDVERPTFPRSSAKIIQALPLVESGAADKLGLTIEELAIAGASHNGEQAHCDTAHSMLRKAGSTPTRSNAACTGRSGPTMSPA